MNTAAVVNATTDTNATVTNATVNANETAPQNMTVTSNATDTNSSDAQERSTNAQDVEPTTQPVSLFQRRSDHRFVSQVLGLLRSRYVFNV